jgi:serine/threonine protein phosphatase 1
MDSTVTAAPWAGRFSRPINRYVIGDVHGCCRTLRTLVENILMPQTDDAVFLLGDYIDRGPDSKGVLDYLVGLMERGDITVLPLMGNHEELCLRAALGDRFAARVWYDNGGLETLHQFGVERPEDIPQHYLDLIAAMPRIRIEPDYVLVHAGLDFETDDPLLETSALTMLWDRNLHPEPRNIGGRTLVCGHNVTPFPEIKASLATQVIHLDNGCFSRGNMDYGGLMALNLDTRQLLVQKNCEEDMC